MAFSNTVPQFTWLLYREMFEFHVTRRPQHLCRGFTIQCISDFRIIIIWHPFRSLVSDSWVRATAFESTKLLIPKEKSDIEFHYGRKKNIGNEITFLIVSHSD